MPEAWRGAFLIVLPNRPCRWVDDPEASWFLVVSSAGVTILMRKPQAKRTGWIVTGGIGLTGLLIIQILRTLDTMWR